MLDIVHNHEYAVHVTTNDDFSNRDDIDMLSLYVHNENGYENSDNGSVL